MKTINTSRGHSFLIDDEDFDKVNTFTWSSTGPFGKRNRIYAATTIKGKQKKLHRFLMNASKGIDVDHINGNTFDNRRCNLRICTRSENMRNMKSVWGQVPFKGVWKHGDKFRTSIWDGNKAVLLGSFNTDIEAARAYDLKAKELFGEFASTNF